MKTGSFDLYKRSGVAQFRFVPPRADEKGYIEKNGGLLMDCAPGSGRDKEWDWSKKQVFMFGIPDIAQILDNPEEPRKLIHKTDTHTKSVFFKPGVGDYEGTYMMQLAVSDGKTMQNINVPFSCGEYVVFVTLIKSLLPYMAGFLDSGIT
jgi:hypothetical protein